MSNDSLKDISSLQNTVYRYLKKRNVRGGGCKTPLFVLYYHYVTYCRTNYCKFVSPIEFARRMTVYFEKGKSGRYSYYLTNLEPPESKRRRRIRLWYDKIWARMRNDKKEEK